MLAAPDCDTKLLSCFYLPPPFAQGPPPATPLPVSRSLDPRLLCLWVRILIQLTSEHISENFFISPAGNLRLIWAMDSTVLNSVIIIIIIIYYCYYYYYYYYYYCCCYYYYYYYYTICMSPVTDLFFPVLLLNQRWSPPLTLQASHCSTFRIMCDVPSIAVFCSESIECFPGTVSKFVFIIIIIITELWTVESIAHISLRFPAGLQDYNYYYWLQLGCHPVAVVILHVYKTWNWLLLDLSLEGYMRSM